MKRLATCICLFLVGTLLSCDDGPPLIDAQIDSLIQQLSSESSDERTCAAITLQEHYAQAGPRLRERLDGLPDRAKFEALCLIVRNDDEVAVRDAVRVFVRSVEKPSLESLGSWGHVTIGLRRRHISIPVADLQPWLKSKIADVRIAALQTLRSNPDVFDCAYQLLSDPDANVRITALQTADAKTDEQRDRLGDELAKRYEQGNFEPSEIESIALSLGVTARAHHANALLAILDDPRLSEETRHWVACAVLRNRDGVHADCEKRPASEVIRAAKRVLTEAAE